MALGWSWVLALGLGALYLSTLLPGVGYHPDTARFQYVGKVLGTPHPTGYPSFTILDHFFVGLFPFGSIAWRANLLSALLAIAAALVLARLLERLEVQPPLATAAALAFGCAPAVWSQSIVAEVYTGHLLLMVSVLLFALRWLDAGEERDFRRASALYAFSFSHHLTAVTLLPALLFLGWQREGVRLFRPARLAWLAGCGFLALLPYGYIFWRSLDPETVYLEAQATDAASFLRLLAPDNARGNLFGFSLGTLLTERLPSFLRLLWGQFGPLLAVAVFGLAILRPRKITLTLALAALGSLVFALNYDIPDIETYYLVVYLVVAVFLGVGLDRLGRMLPEGLRPLLATLALAAPVAGAALHYAAVDQSHNTELARRLEAVLDTAGSRALIVPAGRPQARFFQYYLLAEGLERERELFVTWPPEAAAGYLKGEPTHPDHEPRLVPAGLAVYCLTAAERDRFVAQGFRSVEVSRGLVDLYLIFDPAAAAPEALTELEARYQGPGFFFDREGGRLLSLPGDALPAPESLDRQASPFAPGRIERVNGTWVDRRLEVGRDQPLVVEGWALDPSGEPARGVFLELDGELLATHYGSPRPELGGPDSDRARQNRGFRGLVLPERLTPGPHRLGLGVLGRDGRTVLAARRSLRLLVR